MCCKDSQECLIENIISVLPADVISFALLLITNMLVPISYFCTVSEIWFSGIAEIKHNPGIVNMLLKSGCRNRALADQENGSSRPFPFRICCTIKDAPDRFRIMLLQSSACESSFPMPSLIERRGSSSFKGQRIPISGSFHRMQRSH
jgi:hypothetical protein